MEGLEVAPWVSGTRKSLRIPGGRPMTTSFLALLLWPQHWLRESQIVAEGSDPSSPLV